jgi:hypothetical protein
MSRARFATTFRAAAGLVVAVVALGAGSEADGATLGSSSHSRSVFYLNLKAGECARLPMKHKHLRVVPCRNPRHQLEVFAVDHHVGWGLTEPPHRIVVRLSFTVCNNAFLQRFRRVIRPPYGYIAYWPDPGAETRKYGDRMICALVGPRKGPMGPGTHFRMPLR